MSDTGQGEGWWQASDGKWYPPEQHPDYQAGATQSMGAAQPPPTTAMPPVPPAAPPPGPGGPGGPGGPPPGAPGAGSSNAKWIIVGVLAVAIVVIAAILLTRDDGKKDNIAATGSSSSSSSSSKSSSSSSSSSKSSSSSSKSSSSSSNSSSSSSCPTAADVQARLLKASDIGPDFSDSEFTDTHSTTPCGQPDVDEQVPPQIDVGHDAFNDVGFFEEEAEVYKSAAEADKAEAAIKQSVSCPEPSAGSDGEPLQISGPTDVTSQISPSVEEAFAYDVQTTEAQGKIIFVRNGPVIVQFSFFAQTGADTSQLPDEISVVNKGVAKLAA